MAKPSDADGDFAELLDAVRGIRWAAHTVVRAAVPGGHTSRLWGTSAEFTEYRNYRQGDDLRRIDWKLFARSDRAYIKLSNEHSVLPTMIAIDASASMAFPVATKGKWRLASELAIGLAAVARNGNDPVGVVIVGGGDTVLLPPRTRRGTQHEIIRAVATTAPLGTSEIAPSIAAAAHSVGRLVILTDFLGDADELLSLCGRLVAAGAEVHAVHVVAREEIDPSRDSATVVDPESPDLRRALVGETRDAYISAFAEWREKIARGFTEAGVAFTQAIVGDETPEHLIRRLTAPRGSAAAV